MHSSFFLFAYIWEMHFHLCVTPFIPSICCGGNAIWKHSSVWLCLSLHPSPLSSLLLSTPTASVNNVLTFCLLVPKPSTSLNGLQACLDVQALSSHAALATTVASEFQWREWKGDISHNTYPAITRCSIQHGCRECSFFLLQLFYDDWSDKLFLLQIHLFELLFNSKLIQVGCPLHSLPLFYLFLLLFPSSSSFISPHIPPCCH